ncbi:SPFH domain-containing protein [Streptomyces wedmorensis]|uniref:SPFH domain-containing protein n=1 Tax=Streptomyces wedmorensis TaxID=43759 RepID=UPI003431AC8C
MTAAPQAEDRPPGPGAAGSPLPGVAAREGLAARRVWETGTVSRTPEGPKAAAEAAGSVTAPVVSGAAGRMGGTAPGPVAGPGAGGAGRKTAEAFASAAVRTGGSPAIPVAGTTVDPATGTAITVTKPHTLTKASGSTPIAAKSGGITSIAPKASGNIPIAAKSGGDTGTGTGIAPAPHSPAPLDDRLPDFGRITGAKVGAVAVPVAAVVRVARRKNVIGAETTGSIPVHLLFRDEPEGVVAGAVGDDGGPDTVAMVRPVPAKDSAPAKSGGRPAIPAPSKVQSKVQGSVAPAAGQGGRDKPGRRKRESRPEAGVEAVGKPRQAEPLAGARPAPTADPGLVERPAPVLPGWVGVVAGALAIAGSAAVVWWTGAVPDEAARMLRLPVRPYNGIHLGQWALLALGVVATLFALGGLGRGRVGYAWVLTLFGDYRGTVRRTGLVWVSPLLLRRRVDVRLRHWRSEPLSAVDAKGTALDVVVLVVWRVRDTVRAALGVDGHEEYLREQVEAAMARVLSQLPADVFHEDAPTLRDAEAVGEALTRMLSAECAPVGVDVFSVQPTRIEYAPEVAAAMQRRRIAAIDAKHRDSVLTSVVDAVDDVVHRLTSRGLVELDDYERKALVKDLTVAFYTGRTAPAEGA